MSTIESHGTPGDVPPSTTSPPLGPPPSTPTKQMALSLPRSFKPAKLPGSPSRPLGPMFYPGGGGGGSRSISLSPTHLMRKSSRRTSRAATTTTPSSSLLLPAPNMPFMNATSCDIPVRFSEHQRAMEQAVALERKRSKEMEEQEKDLDADQLRKILKQERQRMAGMARTIADLKSTAVQCQSEAEIHEEGRINCLLGRLETMQIEKGRIVNELEREEEMLTNTLQKKLDQVRREKQELEKLIEHEQTSHANLQSKLTGFPSDNACAQATDVGPMLTALDEGEDEDDEDTDLDAVLPDLAAMYGTL